MKFKSGALAFLVNAFFLCGAFSVGAQQQQQLPETIWSQFINGASASSIGSAYSVKFSPDGQRLYAGGSNSYDHEAGSITIFNAANGTVLGTTPYFRPVHPVNELAISPDGLRLSTANNGVACTSNDQTNCSLSYILYDSQSLNRISEPQTTFSPSQSVDYSPDGQIVAVGEFFPTDNIKFLNPSNLATIRALPGHSLGANNGRTLSVRFSPDGQLLASGGGDDKVKIWRVSDGVLLRTLTMNSAKVEVFSVNFSPDGQYIAAADRDNTSKIRIWRVSDGALIRTFTNPSFANISSHKVVWTPDGRYVVTSFVTVSSGSRIRFWDFNTGELTREYSVPYIDSRTPSSIKEIEFSADGRTFAYALGPRVFLARSPFAPTSAFADFDGDGQSDPAVYRSGTWYMQQSRSGFASVQFGLPSDKIMPADFDGDGKTDIAVFRDGVWYWLNSSNNNFSGLQFGAAGDVPICGDFTGDGRAELGIYRNGVWWTYDLANNRVNIVQFGIETDKTVPADFDGDGKIDYAVYRNGSWHYLRSSDNGYRVISFGIASDIPMIGDYDGDGTADPAVYRNGVWHVNGSTRGYYAAQFGIASDIPTAADYDGDGTTDFAVYRSGTWYILNSQTGVRTIQFGLSDDKPIQSAFVR